MGSSWTLRLPWWFARRCVPVGRRYGGRHRVRLRSTAIDATTSTARSGVGDHVAPTIVAAAGVATLTIVWTTSGDDRVWRRAGTYALGTDRPWWLVSVVAVATAVGIVVAWSTSASGWARRTLTAGAIVFVSVGAVLLVVQWIAFADGQIERRVLMQPRAARFFASVAVMAVPIAWFFRVRGLFTAALVVFAIGFAVFSTAWSASFVDNAEAPTPLIVAVAVLAIPPVIAWYSGRRNPVPMVAPVGLAVHLAALPVVVHDAMVCDNNDCVPIPIGLQLVLLGVIWGGSAWLARSRRGDESEAPP